MGHSLRKKKTCFQPDSKYNIYLHLKIILLEELSIILKPVFKL